MLLEEFDKSKTAIINPSDFEEKIAGMPKTAVTCFSAELLEKLVKKYEGEKISFTHNANGYFPIYKINFNGTDIALFTSCVTAPSSVAEYEEVFAQGVERIITFGTCGVLSKEIDDLAIIIPTSAMRDEGVSYHYKESTDEIVTNPKYISEFISLLEEHNYSYTLGKTWTTDAIYRETKDKMKRRKEQGCICVDMEASALFALAEFRGKEIFEFFYAADNLDDAIWDKRSLHCSKRIDEKEKIGILAITFAEKLNKLDHKRSR
ncbi:MAG: nucleoside phosphorylase [Bacilli bacterium]|nr:nucleoside phosphorylase [Bacilli bacterium]